MNSPDDPIDAYVSRFAVRVVQDALTQASADYWRRRASTFAAAAPRVTDFNGQATPAELAVRAERMRETAQACAYRATLSPVEVAS